MALNPKKDESRSTKSNETSEFDLYTSDFEIVVKKNYYIDKSLFIKDMLENDIKCMFIIAPRCFGKSTNLTMLKSFLEVQVTKNGHLLRSPNCSIFEKLQIYQDDEIFEKHFAKYPVIYVDFKNVNGRNYDEVVDSYRQLLNPIFKQFPYLMTSKKLNSEEMNYLKCFHEKQNGSVAIALSYLIKFLYEHFDKQQVFILIDNFPSLFNKFLFDECITRLLGFIYLEITKSYYVKKVVLTDFTNFQYDPCCVLHPTIFRFQNAHPFVPYYGLTEFELSCLLNKYQIDGQIRKQVKSYYGTYVSISGVKIFPLLSILNFLKTKKIGNFWHHSTIINDFVDALNLPIFRYVIEKLCLKQIFAMFRDLTDITSFQKLLKQRLSSKESARKQSYYLLTLLHEGYVTFEKIVPSASCGVVSHDKLVDFFQNQLLTYSNNIYRNSSVTLNIRELSKIFDKIAWNAEYISLSILPSRFNYYKIKVASDEIVDVFQNHLVEYYKNKYEDSSIISNAEELSKIFNKITCNSEDEIFRNFLTKFNILLQKLNSENCLKNTNIYRNLMFDILCKSDLLMEPLTIPFEGLPDLYFFKNNLGVIISVKYENDSKIDLEQLVEEYVNDFDSWHNMNRSINEKIFVRLNISENKVANMHVVMNSTDPSNVKSF